MPGVIARGDINLLKFYYWPLNNLYFARMTWHVTPINDERPHEESITCECQPRVEFVNGNTIVIHSSFDGREGLEIVNEILRE